MKNYKLAFGLTYCHSSQSLMMFSNVETRTTLPQPSNWLVDYFIQIGGERNLERIVEQSYGQISDANYQRVHHFITDSPWNSHQLMNKVAKQASDLFDNWKDTAYIIDEKSHLKKGKYSVGVANQYAGTVGKTENCQVGVYTALVNGEYTTPINTRLFYLKSG